MIKYWHFISQSHNMCLRPGSVKWFCCPTWTAIVYSSIIWKCAELPRFMRNCVQLAIFISVCVCCRYLFILVFLCLSPSSWWSICIHFPLTLMLAASDQCQWSLSLNEAHSYSQTFHVVSPFSFRMNLSQFLLFFWLGRRLSLSTLAHNQFERYPQSLRWVLVFKLASLLVSFLTQNFSCFWSMIRFFVSVVTGLHKFERINLCSACNSTTSVFFRVLFLQYCHLSLDFFFHNLLLKRNSRLSP